MSLTVLKLGMVEVGDMGEPPGLLSYGGDPFGIGMAEGHDGDAGAEVQEAAAFVIVQPHTLAAVDDQRASRVGGDEEGVRQCGGATASRGCGCGGGAGGGGVGCGDGGGGLGMIGHGVSPISLGLDDGHVYNVNADEAAAAVAAAMGAVELAFVADVPGVRLADGRLAEHLDEGQVLGLIADGTVHGGMVPKVRAALDALARGVRAVRIVDVAGLATGRGTLLVLG